MYHTQDTYIQKLRNRNETSYFDILNSFYLFWVRFPGSKLLKVVSGVSQQVVF